MLSPNAPIEAGMRSPSLASCACAKVLIPKADADKIKEKVTLAHKEPF
jgi:hypothetical protein